MCMWEQKLTKQYPLNYHKINEWGEERGSNVRTSIAREGESYGNIVLLGFYPEEVK